MGVNLTGQYAAWNYFQSVKNPANEKFIKAFREHHDDPEAMTLGDFVEVNADNFFVCLPVLVPCTLWLDVEAHLHLSVYLAVLIAFVTVTNELHKRAHLPAARGPLGVLQRSRLVLAPGHHGVHHTPPHDGYYCITAGVLNPVLARLRFWPALRRLCAVPAALPPARGAHPSGAPGAPGRAPLRLPARDAPAGSPARTRSRARGAPRAAPPSRRPPRRPRGRARAPCRRSR